MKEEKKQRGRDLISKKYAALRNKVKSQIEKDKYAKHKGHRCHHHHHRHHHHHQYRESCPRHRHHRTTKNSRARDLNDLAALLRPMLPVSSGQCKLFEIDDQAKSYLRMKANKSKKNCGCTCSTRKNKNLGKPKRHRHRHSNEITPVENFSLQNRSTTSKKRKLKKDKSGISEEHLEFQTNINKSSKLDDSASASNLSFASLTSRIFKYFMDQ